MNKEEITRKEMFIGKFRSKLTYVFNSADLEDVESIIDFYEQELNQLEWELDSRTNYYNDAKELYFKARDKVSQLETRIDKAIEYIETQEKYIFYVDWKEVLNILKGSEK